MSLSGSQLERVTQALRSAYTRDELRAVLRVCMEEDFDDLVADKAFAAQVFDLVRWAERYGRVEQLVRCAAAHNPGNAALQRLAAEVAVSGASPATTATPPTAGHHVFLAHSHLDAEITRRLRAALSAAGIIAWTDADLEPGTSLPGRTASSPPSMAPGAWW